MFDIGFSEIILLAAVALVVLGPQKLPHAARIAGAWYGRIRRTLAAIQAEIEQEVNALEVRQQFQAGLKTVKDMDQQLRTEFNALEGSYRQGLNPIDWSYGIAQPLTTGGQRFYFLLGLEEKRYLWPPLPYCLPTVVHSSHNHKAVQPLASLSAAV